MNSKSLNRISICFIFSVSVMTYTYPARLLDSTLVFRKVSILKWEENSDYLKLVLNKTIAKVGFQVLAATSTKMTAFWGVAPIISVLMMKAVSLRTTETSVYFYEPTKHYIPEGYHLRQSCRHISHSKLPDSVPPLLFRLRFRIRITTSPKDWTSRNTSTTNSRSLCQLITRKYDRRKEEQRNHNA
jgi:hypothetical protein